MEPNQCQEEDNNSFVCFILDLTIILCVHESAENNVKQHCLHFNRCLRVAKECCNGENLSFKVKAQVSFLFHCNHFYPKFLPFMFLCSPYNAFLSYAVTCCYVRSLPIFSAFILKHIESSSSNEIYKLDLRANTEFSLKFKLMVEFKFMVEKRTEYTTNLKIL